MVIRFKSNQNNKLRESVEDLNVKDVWYKYFDGTFDSVDNICKILGTTRKGITEAYIPNGVTRIGDWAFEDCTSLKNITIPNSVTRIEDHTFSTCESLTSITIPDNVREIGFGAFFQCDSLTSVTIPDSVTRIGSLAFVQCPSLKSVTIGNGVTKIGMDALEIGRAHV